MVNEIEIIESWKFWAMDEFWIIFQLLELFSFSSILHFFKSSTSFDSYVVSIIWVRTCVAK